MKKNLIISAFLLCTVWIAYGQWTYTNLSEPKGSMGSAAIGNKVYLAGGNNGTEFLSEVQVYDVIDKTWESLDGGLFYARAFPGGYVACGSKVFFAGGFDWVTSFNTVDIYDTETEEWDVQFLSDDRFSIASVSHGDTVMFAGGLDYPALVYKSVVDIYDIQTEEWSTTNLSIAREGIASAVVGNLALFAGGLNDNGMTNRVDIYDFTTNTWSIASLSQARAYASAVTVGTKVIIAGGATSYNNPTDRVDIYDASTDTWSQAALSSPRSDLNNGAAVGGKAYFAGGGNFVGNGFNNPSDVVDIYDEASNTWSVMNLLEPRIGASVLGVGDYLVVAGGGNNSGNLSSVEIYHHPTLIHVPADYSTIQDGINEASYNDTVLVAGGTYYENINFIGKPILLASEFILDGDTNHINNTIIDGSQPANPDIGSVVTFTSGGDTTSVLCGFTITGGTGTYVSAASARAGGGVFIQYSGGKIINNHIEYNQAKYQGWAIGGGINAGGPISPMPWVIIRNNRINHNKAESTVNDWGEGGGVLCFYNLVMTDNEVSHNKATGALSGQGGGVYIRGDMGTSWFNFSRNIVTYNEAITNSSNSLFSLGGGFEIWQSFGIATGNLFAFNSTESSPGAESYGSGVFIQEVPNSDLVFENNLILNNSFIGGVCNGGGLCLWITGGTYQNNVIQNNAGTNGGGIFFGNSPSDTAILINNTITENEATIGGGIHVQSSKSVIVNSIIWGNDATTEPSIYQTGSAIEVRYSDVEGDAVWPGEGNLNCTPTFLADGYHLDSYCQLVNEGIASVMINGLWYDCPAYDIDGEMRPYASTQPEIGADEVDFATSARSLTIERLTAHVYPNPADQMVTISIKNGEVIKEVTIYNQVGQNVYKGLPDDNTLDVSKLQPGVYLIEVITDQSEIREKLIIE